MVSRNSGSRRCPPPGPGGPYVPDTEIEEVAQNLSDLEWILKDMVLAENILLIGEAGVGKNKLESYLAHLLRTNLLVVGMSGETRVSDLLTYRSFGEEEEGRTGDTATLGLRALTDPDHRWIIVLDEANKAQPGVLVSFNDLLQDRMVRLPGGTEAPVRSTICVNINPNRPPYEVNDFSFEFMDRFSIHTIVHLPADQAVEVLAKKYPQADRDFVRDVVHGFYALHPLYTGGVLFEPVTMRNEEAAIERGLQYPDRAVNLIDLLSASYGPRGGREQNAISSTLQAEGYDRSVLPAAWALEKFRACWEEDRSDERNAIALAETYRAIGKPTAALDVHHEMLGRHPGRDWVHRLRRGWILDKMGRTMEAAAELCTGFSPGSLIGLPNGECYQVMDVSLKMEDTGFILSIEAHNSRTGAPALVVSGTEVTTSHSIHRASGEFVRVFVDKGHELVFFELQPDLFHGRHSSGEGPPTELPGRIPSSEKKTGEAWTPGPGTDSGPGDATYPEERPGECGNSPVPYGEGAPEVRPFLSTLVEEIARVVVTGEEFSSRSCRLPSPPWGEPVIVDGKVVRELADDGGRVRLTAGPGKKWRVEFRDDGAAGTGRNHATIEWIPGDGPTDGTLSCSSAECGNVRVPLPSDPFIQFAFRVDDQSFNLVLRELPCPGSLERPWYQGEAGNISWSILTLPEYRNQVVTPCIAGLVSRLEGIFRYARSRSLHYALGAGDVVYTLTPGSGIGISVVAEVDGMGPVICSLPAGEDEELPAPVHHPPGGTGETVTGVSGMVIPLLFLDQCEMWKEGAGSSEVQAHLQEVRRYVAPAILNRTRPRDMEEEAKYRAFLAGLAPMTEPVTAGGPVLSRGDILVRTDAGDESLNRPRSVFIVRFVQDGGEAHGEPEAIVRGFWLGEENPVATERLGKDPGKFGRVTVDGDDTCPGILHRLTAACRDTLRHWEFSRSGSRFDPVDRFTLEGLEVEYQPVDRRFRVSATGEEDGEQVFFLEQTGYPTGKTTLRVDGRELAQWQGTPLADIRYYPGLEQVMVLLEDDLVATLRSTRMIGGEPLAISGGLSFVVISQSEGEQQNTL